MFYLEYYWLSGDHKGERWITGEQYEFEQYSEAMAAIVEVAKRSPPQHERLVRIFQFDRKLPWIRPQLWYAASHCAGHDRVLYNLHAVGTPEVVTLYTSTQ